MAAMAPPHGNEHYIKNAMVPPQGVDVIDPWADQLDELDPRELAMSRYRARNEMMAEVFGPEPISEYDRLSTTASVDRSRACVDRPQGSSSTVIT